MKMEALRGAVSENKAHPKQDSIEAEASSEFVNSPYVQDITKLALMYLKAGYPLHLSGSAGTGKPPWPFN